MKKTKKTLILRCHKYLDIYNPRYYEETLKFIHSLDKLKIESFVKEFVISFIQTKEIKAAASVLLYAKLEELLSYNLKFRLRTDFNIAIANQLKRAGFYTLMRQGNQNNIFSCNKLPIISGKSGEFREEIIDFIKEQIYQNKFDDNLEYVYGDAIQEAINNVSLHAYPNKKDQEKKWWLYCTLINDELYLVLYDRGNGIPKTFTKGNQLFDEIDWSDEELREEIQQNLDRWGLEIPSPTENLTDIDNVKSSDSARIYFAMADDITRMIGKDELKHGQGSKSIKKLVSSHEEGILWIFSNKGLFRYHNDDTMPFLQNFNHSINGTLIQWNIKVFINEAN